MGDDDAELERRCQFHYAMPQGIETCPLREAKGGSTQHLLLSNGGGRYRRMPRIESTFKEESNHQKERRQRKSLPLQFRGLSRLGWCLGLYLVLVFVLILVITVNCITGVCNWDCAVIALGLAVGLWDFKLCLLGL
ncbi:hypothetical protein GIB67_027913 [Kingdonia uniflora]|uniref:Uncharacterized protein n=1 Tax=Kingdonia uniflora TaxID=39325 RepID=A0A7J7LGH1_9MAGN|nr:hypothetical protein GIB67_027913 [Kingdonia uniflora]